MMLLTLMDDEGIGRICTGPIVVLGNAIDFFALILPGREEIAREDVTDGVVHHVQVIEDIGDFGIFFRELGTQFSGHRHKGPFHGWLVEIAMIGSQNRLDGLLLGRKIVSVAQRVIHHHL